MRDTKLHIEEAGEEPAAHFGRRRMMQFYCPSRPRVEERARYYGNIHGDSHFDVNG